jgi:hypothetical protein
LKGYAPIINILNEYLLFIFHNLICVEKKVLKLLLLKKFSLKEFILSFELKLSKIKIIIENFLKNDVKNYTKVKIINKSKFVNKINKNVVKQIKIFLNKALKTELQIEFLKHLKELNLKLKKDSKRLEQFFNLIKKVKFLKRRENFSFIPKIGEGKWSKYASVFSKESIVDEGIIYSATFNYRNKKKIKT